MNRSRSPYFQRTPSFDRVDDSVLKGILQRATPVRLVRRQVLWEQGDPVGAIGWIRSGLVRDRVQLDDRELILAFYGRGDLVGEVGALESLARTDVVRSSTVEAHEESVVVSLDLRSLSDLVDREPGLARGLAATSAERRRRLEERLIALVHRTARARIATALLDLAARFGVRDSRGVIVNIRLTHRDLAGLAGASRETASTALLDWRRDGLVQIEGKRVVLLRPDALADLARDA